MHVRIARYASTLIVAAPAVRSFFCGYPAVPRSAENSRNKGVQVAVGFFTWTRRTHMADGTPKQICGLKLHFLAICIGHLVITSVPLCSFIRYLYVLCRLQTLRLIAVFRFPLFFVLLICPIPPHILVVSFLPSYNNLFAYGIAKSSLCLS